MDQRPECVADGGCCHPPRVGRSPPRNEGPLAGLRIRRVATPRQAPTTWHRGGADPTNHGHGAQKRIHTPPPSQRHHRSSNPGTLRILVLGRLGNVHELDLARAVRKPIRRVSINPGRFTATSLSSLCRDRGHPGLVVSGLEKWNHHRAKCTNASGPGVAVGRRPLGSRSIQSLLVVTTRVN